MQTSVNTLKQKMLSKVTAQVAHYQSAVGSAYVPGLSGNRPER
jgi:hypothetical protein